MGLCGFNHMTDEEYQQKIEEFKSFFYPKDGAPEEVAEFFKQLALFKELLDQFKTNPNNILINLGRNNAEEDEGVFRYMQSRIASSPVLQQQLQITSQP